MWGRILIPAVLGRTNIIRRKLYTMKLKTSDFQSLFTDGLNGLAGEDELLIILLL